MIEILYYGLVFGLIVTIWLSGRSLDPTRNEDSNLVRLEKCTAVQKRLENILYCIPGSGEPRTFRWNMGTVEWQDPAGEWHAVPGLSETQPAKSRWDVV